MKSFYAKIFFIVAIFFAFLQAHPPSGIAAEYDTLEQTLKITVDHSVKYTNKHYVNKIEILANSEKKIEQLSTKQSNESSQNYMFKIIDVKMGDTLNITATCNISGKKRVYFLLAPGKLDPLEK
jgi:desulfoferrodoxin (superoxide reductase-like protein)